MMWGPGRFSKKLGPGPRPVTSRKRPYSLHRLPSTTQSSSTHHGECLALFLAEELKCAGTGRQTAQDYVRKLAPNPADKDVTTICNQ